MIECNWPTCGCQNVHGAPWCKASTVVQPSPALSALAMRERAAAYMEKPTHQGIRPTWPSDIRTLPTTFTNAELLAAARLLPEVQALEAIAHYFTSTNKDDVTVILAGNPNVCRGVIDAARAALAPFVKGGE